MGIGKALISLAEEDAKKLGYKICSLLAKDSFVKGFYEKLNFVFKQRSILESATDPVPCMDLT